MGSMVAEGAILGSPGVNAGLKFLTVWFNVCALPTLSAKVFSLIGISDSFLVYVVRLIIEYIALIINPKPFLTNSKPLMKIQMA